MKSAGRFIAIAGLCLLLIGFTVQAKTPDQALQQVADRLVDIQITAGSHTGSWPDEPDFTGSIVAGLAKAYMVTGDSDYKQAAELGAEFIFSSSNGNYYGDEAYALMCLSEAQCDPSDNIYRDALTEFYQSVTDSDDGTAGYITWFESDEPSNAVFYVAYHTLAAFYVDAADKAMWREALIGFLADVDDDIANYPVMSLGVATWVLAQTGGLDSTLVDPSAAPGSQWDGVTLADLPAMILTHQYKFAPAADLYGSFYWRYDHDDGNPSGWAPNKGFVEDTIYSSMGLIQTFAGGCVVKDDIDIAVASLVNAVRADGKLYDNVRDAWAHYQYETYGGELLQLLSLVVTPSPQAAIGWATDALVSAQITAGSDAGSWPGEPDYTGSIVPGLICAYLGAGACDVLDAAEAGGNYILNSANGNFFGDEAYALMRLSELAYNPQDNPWRDALEQFYQEAHDRPDIGNGPGTAGYIADFAPAELSTAVFYLAHHVVAANYVDATDKAIWRNALIAYLGAVTDDTADYPVLALGVSLWALAQTGPLDATLVDPAAAPGSLWDGVTLADLPGILLTHQVPECGLYAGSFYWRFDHTDGNPATDEPAAGFTEDTIYGLLGLMAAGQAEIENGFNNPYVSEIAVGQQVLARAVDPCGKVYEHIWLKGTRMHVYAGELLQALCGSIPDCWFCPSQMKGDVNGDGKVNLFDLCVLKASFRSVTGQPNYEPCADFNRDGKINLADLIILKANFGAMNLGRCGLCAHVRPSPCCGG